MNTLEQLLKEWLHIRGFIVETNLKVGRRSELNPGTSAGGWVGELDVVAYHPVTGELYHFEPSLDSHTWDTRKERFARKFQTGRDYIRTVAQFANVPAEHFANLKQVALLSHTPKGMADRIEFAGGEAWTIDSFVEEVNAWVRSNWSVAWAGAIPESYPLLRVMQFSLVGNYRKVRA